MNPDKICFREGGGTLSGLPGQALAEIRRRFYLKNKTIHRKVWENLKNSINFKTPGMSQATNIFTMKQLIFSAALFMAICLPAINSSAQGNPARMEQMKEMLRQELKDSLQLPDALADSVTAIQINFQSERRAVFMDQSLSDSERTARMSSLNSERQTRLKSFLTADQQAKFDAMMERRREQMRNRMRNGGGS